MWTFGCEFILDLYFMSWTCSYMFLHLFISFIIIQTRSNTCTLQIMHFIHKLARFDFLNRSLTRQLTINLCRYLSLSLLKIRQFTLVNTINRHVLKTVYKICFICTWHLFYNNLGQFKMILFTVLHVCLLHTGSGAETE